MSGEGPHDRGAPGGPGSPERPEGGGEPQAPPDSPAARRRWLLTVAVILAAMIVVPGVVSRLSRPAPVPVTVAPPGPDLTAPDTEGSEPAEWVAELGRALDAHPALVFVPWPPDGPEAARVRVELDLPQEPSDSAAVGVRLLRWPDGAPVWEGRVEVEAGEARSDRLARVARAVAEALARR